MEEGGGVGANILASQEDLNDRKNEDFDSKLQKIFF